MGFLEWFCRRELDCFSFLSDRRTGSSREAQGKRGDNYFRVKRTVQTSRIIHNRQLEDDYVCDRVIGTGLSGSVRVATHRDTGQQVAVKQLRTADLTPLRIKNLLEEVEIYLVLDHPNICRLLAVYDEKHTVYLVMEVCTGKELYDRLMEQVRYSEADTVNIMQQILSAVRYCHAQKICHRDLKLENFVFQDESKSSRLKMIDFGLSKVFSPGIPMTALTGTVYYVSPEVMQGSYDQMCDLWSVGVIAYMLLSGQPPFSGQNDKAILSKIQQGIWRMRGSVWQGISADAKDFVSRLLKKDPADRMTAEQSLQHPWLAPRMKASSTDKLTSSPELVGVLESMRLYSRESALKRAVIAVLAHEVSADELGDLTKHFHELDIDGDGTVTIDELTAAMREYLTLADEEAELIFSKLDHTGDRTIHYSEFLAACMSAKFVLKEQHVYSLFQRFDSDQKGYITVENLQNILGENYKGTPMQDLLREFDLDGNGLIDYQEFVQCVMGRAHDDENDAKLLLRLCQMVDEQVLREYSRQKLGRSFTVCELTPAHNTIQRLENTKKFGTFKNRTFFRYHDPCAPSTLLQESDLTKRRRKTAAFSDQTDHSVWYGKRHLSS